MNPAGTNPSAPSNRDTQNQSGSSEFRTCNYLWKLHLHHLQKLKVYFNETHRDTLSALDPQVVLVLRRVGIQHDVRAGGLLQQNQGYYSGYH